ncbi:peptidase S66 [Bacillus safensis]|uniref:S66 family peptidase n=1 Tax=Bacillus TaxID=1386 RepID=UPI0018CE6EE8|nr:MULTISPECIES: S66 peptidase family protein [Bacillus]MBG9820946.1 peptidase S66 [Bacillus safensis]MBG9824066.1 peptidase S66 [Bacillus safensis]MBG9832682.1 peptidase S66 [Bacillus safensis]MBG9859779.1 peptidase S66 [Bacillus safensis]MBG9897691.1 peptidase S66 [Bacillus safensis]
MIQFPHLQKGQTIGVTAPSSGVRPSLHDMFQLSCERMKNRGYDVICGETVWQQEKAKSAPAIERANELQYMMTCEEIDHIIPPWGGQLLMEVLEHLDFSSMKKKWILGYSDTSALLLALTLKTGIATAHGPNLVDLQGEDLDQTTVMWEEVLSTKEEMDISQFSSSMYQKEWQRDDPIKHVFHLTEPTAWHTVDQQEKMVKGRLLGGCIDVIRHLAGTPYGDVKTFQKTFIKDEPILWYFENCELNAASVKRSLVQLKLAGWFDHCSGIMFGRSAVNVPVEGYQYQDVYEELQKELQIPIFYDIDCGHVPPQMTLINGAYAEVQLHPQGKAVLKQTFLA